MSEKEFNLLDEPWIRVLKSDRTDQEICLKDALLNAEKYICLAGETEQQNAAVTRFLLAIVITILYRYNIDGSPEMINPDWDRKKVLERWNRVWESGHLPSKAVEQYLEENRDAFWLIHPKKPFYQVPQLNYGTDYKSAKTLYGDLKESNNPATRHLFSMREGSSLEKMSFAEAARWLIFYHAYSINLKWNAKAGGEKCGSFIGWLGRIGLIEAAGTNLFESLMLNSVLLKDGEEFWGQPSPSWERKETHTKQGEHIELPNNLPELYTLPSRRIRLKSDSGFVTGYRALLGEYYDAENCFSEQMTLWRQQEDKETKEKVYLPALHREAIQAWREFPTVFSWEKAARVPGLIKWLQKLTAAGYIGKDRILHLKTIGQFYDGMRYLYTGSVFDETSLSFSLLPDKENGWLKCISDEIEKCRQVSFEIGKFSDWLSDYLFGSKYQFKDKLKSRLQEQYYSEIDMRFRWWLISINSDEQEKESKIRQWQKTSISSALSLLENHVQRLSINIFATRKEDDTPAGRLTKLSRNIKNIYHHSESVKGGNDVQDQTH